MRVLLVEDEFGLGDAVSAYLSKTGRSVDWVRNFADGKVAADGSSHDLLIVDLRLPDGNGLELITKLRDTGDVRPLIIISAQDQIRDRIAGLNAGADDYLIKPFNLRELGARLEALQRRAFGRPSPRFQVGGARIDITNERVWVDDVETGLSKVEWILLKRLCSPAGKAVTKEELRDALGLARPGEIRSNAIEVHISRLRSKLGAGVILNKRGIGYRLAV